MLSHVIQLAIPKWVVTLGYGWIRRWMAAAEDGGKWEWGWRQARGSLCCCAVMLPESQGDPGLQALAWGCTKAGAHPASYRAAGCPVLEGYGTALSLW